jgi:ribosomal protein S18 acetylase RimI-like enzyme
LTGVGFLLILLEMLRIQAYQEHKHWLSLMELFTEVFDKSEVPYVEEFQSSNMSYVCTARTGSVQGFILVRATGPATAPAHAAAYEIAFLGIAARYRNKGYATRLVDIVKTNAATGSLWLNVLDVNTGAIALYNKLGFDASERFVSGEGDAATKFTWGLSYACYHCDKVMKPSETRWENLPTSIVLAGGGFQQVLERKSVCWHCRTRIES